MKKVLPFLTAILFCNVAFSQTPTDFDWVKSAGGTATEEGKSVTTDNQGNVIIAGYFKGTATFGSLPSVTAVGGRDAFVAKYDSSGTALWVKTLGGTDTDEASGVATDSLGNIYVSGTYGATVTTDTVTLTSAGTFDVFLLKFDAAGNLKWAKTAGGVNGDNAYDLTTDPAGDVIVVGKFNLATTFGTQNLTSSGQDDLFIVKYDSTGTVVWAKKAGGTTSDFANSVATDAAGNIYVTGNFSGTATFLGSPNVSLTTSGQWDVFTAKYNSSGSVLWAKKGGGSTHDHGLSIAADAAGNSFVTGYFQSTSVNFSGSVLTNAGNWEIYVVKYNTNGVLSWAKKYGSTGYDYAYGIATDRAGKVMITGGFGKTVNFGGVTMTSASTSTEDLFVVKIDSAGGVVQWAMKAGTPGGQYVWGNAITADWDGDIYTTGTYEGSAVFGTTTLTSAGGDEAYGEDIFLARIDQDAILVSAAMNASVSDDIKLYPVPSNGVLTIASKSPIRQINLVSANGQLIKVVGQNDSSISLEGVADGIYMLQITTEDSVITKKFILAH